MLQAFPSYPMTSLRLCCALLCVSPFTVRANYAADVGYLQLQAELGDALPTGAGVNVSQVEAANIFNGGYMAEAGTGSYSGTGFWQGKTFVARSGSTAFSNHASEVGQHFYGSITNGTGGRSSPAPGILTIDGYNASAWTSAFLAPSGLAPLIETRAVQNHSWVNDAPSSSAATFKDFVRRQDYSIHRDNYVCCAGIRNDIAEPVPDFWAACYNALAVGNSSGIHSRGGVTSDMDGPGRRKPDIVVPLDASSFSTGYVSGAAALLRQKANSLGTASARNARTLKAVLLAGATKAEFPGWTKDSAHPIDAIYGAGELNIYNSYHILDGGEQPANNTAARPHRAWDFHSLSANGTADYRLHIPAGQYGEELSAFLVWHRTLTDANPSADTFTLLPDLLVNFDITLFRDPPPGGGNPVSLDASTSTIYNMEHVWKRNLPAANYRLRVSRGNGVAHDFAIAWRLTVAPHVPQLLIVPAGNNLRFDFAGMISGQVYKFQESPDIQAWNDLESFTATTATATRTRPKPADPSYFYQLLPVLP